MLPKLDKETLRRLEKAIAVELGLEFDDDDPVWCDAREIIITGGWRSGKGHPSATPVPTPSGWTEFGALKVGDALFDETGTVCHVIGISPTWNEPCYRVRFSDGTYVDANAQHEWITTRNTGHRPYRRQTSIRETAKMASIKLRSGKNKYLRMPPREALDFDEAILPIDPYVLGVWLGDGTSANGQITSADPEVIAELKRHGLEVHKLTAKYSWGTVGLTTRLRRLGLLKNKHIPPSYLRASKEQRLNLLRGLMDTDGGVQSSNEFYNTNKHLVDGVTELVRGLGWYPRVHTKTARLGNKDCGTIWAVNFQADDAVFTLPRKLARQSLSTPRHLSVEAVEPIPSSPTRCIEVDSPSHLYLVGEGMVPTHNSTRGAFKTFRQLLQPVEKGLIWLLGPDYAQTREEFRYLMEWSTRFNLLSRKPVMPTEGQNILFLKTGWEIATKSARYPEKLGSVAPNAILLCEPGQMSDDVYTMVNGRLAEKRGWMMACGTIEDDSNHPRWTWYEDTARKWLKHGDQYTSRAFTLPSWKNRVVFPGGEFDPEIERLRDLYSDYTFRRRIAGEPVGVEHPCFPELWESDHYITTPDTRVFIDGAIGVDYGTTSEHPSAVVAVRVDEFGKCWIVECWLETGGNPDEIALAVEGMKKRHNIRRGRVDPNEAVLADKLGFNVAVGGGTYGIPTEYRVGIAGGLLRDGHLWFHSTGPRVREVFEAMHSMRRVRDSRGRLTYDRALGDDAAQAALYALEELRGGGAAWLPSRTNYGSMKFNYLPVSKAQLVGRS